MSITITVRPNGATTGGTNQTIPGEGEIDTKEEAEAALSLLPEGSTNTVVVGERTFTRAQLVELRDRLSAPATPASPAAPGAGATPAAGAAPAAAGAAPVAAAAAADTATVPGPGVSHGGEIDGYYSGGLGANGHSGGGVRFGYVPGITLADGDHRLFLDPSIGVDINHSSMDYTTPGGEPASSAFTRYGGYAGAALRYHPPILDHRLFASLGVRLGFGGFGSADTTIVSTPTNCKPGDFGRQECEPGAGAQTGNAGTTGLFDPRTGASVGTGGAYFNFGIPIAIGGEIVRGTWGNAQIFAGVEPNYTSLFPSGSQGFDFWSVAGFAGIRANFGGGAVEKAPEKPVTPAVAVAAAAAAKPDSDGDGVPDDVDACPDEKGVKSVDPKMNGCPPIHLEFVNPASQFVNSPAYNVKLVGAEKMEGVTYTIEAYSNDGKATLLGKLDSSTIEGQNFTLLKKYGSDSINTMGIEPFAPELTAEGVKITGDGKAAKGAKPGEFGPHIRYRFTLIGKDKAPLTSYDFYVTKIVVAAGGRARKGAGQR